MNTGLTIGFGTTTSSGIVKRGQKDTSPEETVKRVVDEATEVTARLRER